MSVYDIFEYIPKDIVRIILIKLKYEDLIKILGNKNLKSAINVNFAKEYMQKYKKFDRNSGYNETDFIYQFGLSNNILELINYSYNPNDIIEQAACKGYIDIFINLFHTKYNNKNYIDYLESAIGIYLNDNICSKQKKSKFIRYIMKNIIHGNYTEGNNKYLPAYILVGDYKAIDNIWPNVEYEFQLESILKCLEIGDYDYKVINYCLDEIKDCDIKKSNAKHRCLSYFSCFSYKTFKFMMSTKLSNLFDARTASYILTDKIISSKSYNINFLRCLWNIIVEGNEIKGFCQNVYEDCDRRVDPYLEKIVMIVGENIIKDNYDIFYKYFCYGKRWTYYLFYIKFGLNFGLSSPDIVVKNAHAKCVHNKNKIKVIATGHNFQTIIFNFNQDSYNLSNIFGESIKIDIIDGNIQINNTQIDNNQFNVIKLQKNDSYVITIINSLDKKIISGSGKFILTLPHAILPYNHSE